MIFLGTDIIQISRIDILIKKYGNKFLDHIFTDIEQDICLNKLKPSIHFSGRFAAKEAVKKAILSSHIHNNISLKSIESISENLLISISLYYSCFFNRGFFLI